MACSFKHCLLNALFPPQCLHCEDKLPRIPPLLCSTCLEQLSLAPIHQRCWTCFAELEKGRCERCIHRPVVIRRQLAATENIGPAATLLHNFSQGQRECIAPMAALMVYQWLEQKMLLPDLVIPLPVSFGNKYKHGFDGNFLLASEVARLFSVPVVRAFHSRFDLSHFLIQGEFRSRYCLKSRRKEPLADRTLLLIAPFLEDARLRSAGELLQNHFPAQLCVLCFTAY